MQYESNPANSNRDIVRKRNRVAQTVTYIDPFGERRANSCILRISFILKKKMKIRDGYLLIFLFT